MNTTFKNTLDYIKSLYPNQNPVPLHAPVFMGKEKEYLAQCIDSTFVSYVGEFVNKFEAITAQFTGAKYAVAVVNGTAGLQIALQVTGVQHGDEVITQPLTFVATANAICHTGATPVFVDVDKDTLGMSPEKLEDWLKKNTFFDNKKNAVINKITGKRISAIVPVYIFGHLIRIHEIIQVAEKYHLTVVEDSTEALGSFINGKHAGLFGELGILSYNGNKTITTGGGGMIITNNEKLAQRVKHITTTAKIPHPYEYVHDEIGYNYRLPNINAAVGYAQMEYIHTILENKKETALLYKNFFANSEIEYINGMENTNPNYWLNAILLKDRKHRDEFLEYSNANGVITRAAWRLMNKLPMYQQCQAGDISNAEWLDDRIVNIPSSVRK